MSCTRFLVAFVALLQASCALPVQRQRYFIAPAAVTAQYTDSDIVAEVQRFALSSGYHRLRTFRSSSQLLAVFVRDPFAIRIYRERGACQIMASVRGYSDRRDALAERQRVYSALQSRGLKMRLAQEQFTDVIDIIPYAP